jgi:polygalacturonase
MKRSITLFLLFLLLCPSLADAKKTALWPDGTPISSWFSDTSRVDVSSLGRRYVLTDYGVNTDSTLVQTTEIQAVIDRCAREGGGVVVVPRGTFLSGSLFFRQGTHLQVEAGGKLKGSDRIEDFRIVTTRIEGQTCQYFSALINADSVDDFTITGPGTIDGNGYHYWKEFWIRRQWNPQCTNKDAQRPRLVYISNSKNVTMQDIRMVNSPFWNNHLYRCDHVRLMGLYIFAPTSSVKAPSSDAIDIDACHDILVHGCYMSVNDDAVALKGGKGTWADKDPDNGPNYNVIVEDCHYGVVHSCLTLGSESVHDYNIVLRNIQADNVNRVLWLKMRPDTPQRYELVRVEHITGNTQSFLVVRPWTQFFKPEKRDDMPLSTCSDITLRDIKMNTKNFFDVKASDKYKLSRFHFNHIDITDEAGAFNPSSIEGSTYSDVKINGRTFKD